ncbi:hypothetical protein ABKN59_007818 [Abortiporus biennis]
MPVLQRSSTHLDSFFNQYAQYTYNPNASVAREFQRLGQRMGWSDDERRIARERYREALTNEFNDIFVPASVLECTRVIKSVNVNLVDVVNAARNPTVVPTPRKFGTVKELRKYSYKNKKIFPRDKAKSGGVLKFMLRMISAA